LSYLLVDNSQHVAGLGGRGGEDCCNTNEGGSPGDVYDDMTLPLTLRPGSGGGGGAGSPGGAGGAGGAAIIFYSEEIAIYGNIKANGSSGGRGPNNRK